MNKLRITLKTLVLTVLVSGGLLATPLLTNVASAQINKGLQSAKTDELKDKDFTGANGLVKQGVNLLLWFVGVASIIMLIFGGIKYITSTGEASKVTAAKNTILYAVIGLIVSLFSYAIVNFVIGQTTAVPAPTAPAAQQKTP